MHVTIIRTIAANATAKPHPEPTFAASNTTSTANATTAIAIAARRRASCPYRTGRIALRRPRVWERHRVGRAEPGERLVRPDAARVVTTFPIPAPQRSVVPDLHVMHRAALDQRRTRADRRCVPHSEVAGAGMSMLIRAVARVCLRSGHAAKHHQRGSDDNESSSAHGSASPARLLPVKESRTGRRGCGGDVLGRGSSHGSNPVVRARRSCE